MRTHYALLAGAGVLALAVGGLGASGVAAAQAAPARAKTARAPTVRSHDRPPATPAVWVRPDFAGYIHVPDGNVLNAAGCGIPANIIEWPDTGSGGCDGGANEYWYVNLQASYSPIYASYGGHRMCMNVDNNNYNQGAQIIAYGCDSGFTNNEEFYTVPYGNNGYYYIKPEFSPNRNLCFNVAGGLGQGHNVILYGCGAYSNEQFNFIAG